MIPPFNRHGELPPGVHGATVAEFLRRFGAGDRRRMLLALLWYALRALARTGIDRVYIAGSFVTDAEEPEDVDAAWVPGPGFDRSRLTSEFLEGSGTLAAQADIPGLHLFPDIVGGALATGWLCQVRGHPERTKGVVLLRLVEGASSVAGQPREDGVTQ